MILGINTATIESSVCVCANGEVIAEKRWKSNKNEAEMLLPSIVSLGFELSELDSILVIQGPGSFSGIRVGIITANTLVQNLTNVELYSINTFDFVSYLSPKTLTLLNAGGSTIFAYQSGELETISLDEFNEKYSAQEVIADLTDEQLAKLDTKKFTVSNNRLQFSELCAKIKLEQDMKVNDLPLLPYYVKEPSITL